VLQAAAALVAPLRSLLLRGYTTAVQEETRHLDMLLVALKAATKVRRLPHARDAPVVFAGECVSHGLYGH
jgi:hypothetical protein